MIQNLLSIVTFYAGLTIVENRNEILKINYQIDFSKIPKQYHTLVAQSVLQNRSYVFLSSDNKQQSLEQKNMVNKSFWQKIWEFINDKNY